MTLKTIAETKYLHFMENEGWAFVTRKKQCVVQGNLKPDAVCIIARHLNNDKLVVIKQWRKSINDYIYEVPAGLIDEGETIEQAARRELKEETGLDIISIEKIIPRSHASIGLSDEIQAIVYCDVAGIPSSDGNEGDENISIELWDEETTGLHVNRGYAIDNKIAQEYWAMNRINTWRDRDDYDSVLEMDDELPENW